MSTSFPTDANIHILRPIKGLLSSRNYEFSYWQDGWKTVRDCIIGEYEIKKNGELYLPKLPGHDAEEYKHYLNRAYFFNMTARTVNGMLGTVFRRAARIHGVDKSIESKLNTITKNGTDVKSFAKDIVYEILAVGRHGVLLDMGAEGGDPFFAGYVAENILDWSVKEINGVFTLVGVLLREYEADRELGRTLGMMPNASYRVNYRILRLDDDGVYRQYFFKNVENVPEIDTIGGEQITPLNMGVPFKFIPFVFFGPLSNGAGVEKSPVLDIALMNINHYQTAAQLEHGRFFTASPVYCVSVGNESESKGAYELGASTVWEYTGEQKPSLLEFHGHGLGSLERALDMKEQHISSLGGRMLGVRSTAVAESDNLVKLKEKNEQSILLNITSTTNIGLTKLLKWWSDWLGKDGSKIEVELNQDFLFDALSAREFRAFTLMYKEGIISIEIMYNVLRKGEIVPEYMSFEEFKKQIEDLSNFPNNPDVAAKKKGFPDAAGQLRDKQHKQTIASEEKIAEMAAAASAAASRNNEPSEEQ